MPVDAALSQLAGPHRDEQDILVSDKNGKLVGPHRVLAAICTATQVRASTDAGALRESAELSTCALPHASCARWQLTLVRAGLQRHAPALQQAVGVGRVGQRPRLAQVLAVLQHERQHARLQPGRRHCCWWRRWWRCWWRRLQALRLAAAAALLLSCCRCCWSSHCREGMRSKGGSCSWPATRLLRRQLLSSCCLEGAQGHHTRWFSCWDDVWLFLRVASRSAATKLRNEPIRAVAARRCGGVRVN